MGPNSAGLPMHPCIHTRIQYKSVDAGTKGAPLPRFWLRAGGPLSCCSSSPRGERSRLKGAKERNPGLGDGRLWAPSLSRCPHPHSPQFQEGGGTQRCEGSCPAPPEQSPPREAAAAHQAGDKGERAAPSSKSALLQRGTRRRPKRWGAICTGFSGAAASRSCVLNDP